MLQHNHDREKQTGRRTVKCNQIYFLKNFTADYTNWTDLKEFRIQIKIPPLPINPQSNYRSDHIMASINTI